jgi:GH15 family glucan-1,4-alpha-glucosidase
MDGIDGRKHLVEETLDHLDGYMGSKPARIGNGAYNQLQLDIYGGLLDAA